MEGTIVGLLIVTMLMLFSLAKIISKLNDEIYSLKGEIQELKRKNKKKKDFNLTYKLPNGEEKVYSVDYNDLWQKI